MEETNDGFKIAEKDLQFRGAGEVLGTRQSGESDIPIEILANVKFIEKVQDAATRLLDRYPNLAGLPDLHAQLHDQLGEVLV